MLLQREVEPSTGFIYENFNAGSMVNDGVEVGLNLLPVNTENFRWNAHINFWRNKSKVTSLPVAPFDVQGFSTSLGVYRIQEGQSATQIVGIDPIIVNNDNIGQFPDAAVGDTVIGNRRLGDGAPDFQISFSNEFRILKNFDLSFLLHWKKGGDVINLTELLSDLLGTSPDYDDTDLSVSPLRMATAGIEPGDNNATRRLKLVGVSTAKMVQDASYLRLREIGLYYHVPVSSMQRLFGNTISHIKIGASATNLLTFTPYKSYDPEVSNFGNQPIAQGIEVAPYPSSKQYYFHLSVDF